MSSRRDCIFEIHQLWQLGFSRVYSNSYSSYWFEPESVKIGQSSHKMYSYNILNFQESTTILNACTKKSGNILKAPRICTCIYAFYVFIYTYRFTCYHMHMYIYTLRLHTYTHIQIVGGGLSVTVIVLRNEIGDPRSNSERGYSCFSSRKWPWEQPDLFSPPPQLWINSWTDWTLEPY